MPPTKTGPQTLLHDDVVELRRQGGTGVSLDHLEQIANTLAPKLSAQEFEKQKALLPLQHNRQMEQFKAVTEAGQTALKTAIAVNGGAAAALLAFLGSLAAKQLPAGTVSSTGKVALAMLVFVGGVLFASLALGARYFTQLTDAWGRTKLAARFNKHIRATRLGVIARVFGRWPSCIPGIAIGAWSGTVGNHVAGVAFGSYFNSVRMASK